MKYFTPSLRYALLSAFLLSSSSFANSLGYLTNFNEPNTAQLVQAIQQKQLHIVQLGDSHTAGDTMTDALRTRLQQQLGNGGMGWAMPMYFNGQRMAKFGYDNVNWQPISSRSTHTENYTLGGMLAKPLQSGATLTIKAKQPETAQNITVSIRQSAQDTALKGIDATGKTFSIEAPVKNGQWQTTQFTATLPFTIQAEKVTDTAIGGWWASQGQGSIVSALGINGSELSQWNRWNTSAWQQELATIRPQLIILAYGTNEAYNNVDAQQVAQVLTQRIQQIRQASPNSAVMVVSAPEALKNIRGQCGTLPAQLTAIQQAQKQVAEQQRTLYWDWQKAMGGSCSMNTWIKQGKALKDGVHFSQSGYQQLGTSLAQDILALANNTATTTPQPQTMTPTITPSVPPTPVIQPQPSTIHSTPTIDESRYLPVIQQLPNNTTPARPTSTVNPPIVQSTPVSSAHICWHDDAGKRYCYTGPYRY